MSFSIPIFALILYPFLYLLPFNLVRFRWGLENGSAPMPRNAQEKAEIGDRVAQCVSYVILLFAVVWLMHGSPISAYAVGLTTDNWKQALGMGILFSLFPLGLHQLALQNIPGESVREQPEAHGPAAVWCGLIVLGSFTHEFWRAFCIVSLIRAGLSVWLAILIVSFVYGSLHIQTSTAKALGSVAFGAASGFLFVDTGSLLSPLTMGLVVTGANFYQIRKTYSSLEQMGPNLQNHRSESRTSKPCPVCRTMIRFAEVNKSGDIVACPGCGESLTFEKKNLWVIGALSIVAAIYFTRHLVYREPVYVFFTELLALIFYLVGCFLITLLIPPNYKLVGGKTFDKTLSLFAPDKPDSHKKSTQK